MSAVGKAEQGRCYLGVELAPNLCWMLAPKAVFESFAPDATARAFDKYLNRGTSNIPEPPPHLIITVPGKGEMVIDWPAREKREFNRDDNILNRFT